MIKILLASTLFLVACQQQFSALDPVIESSIESATCPQSQSGLYDVLYKSLLDLNEVPTENELRNAFQKAMANSSNFKINDPEFLDLVSEFYQIILQTPSTSSADLLQKMTALEIGDQSTGESKPIQEKLQQFQKKWDQYTAQMDMECPTAPVAPIEPIPIDPIPPTVVEPPAEAVSTPVHLLSAGARTVLVTAYQSCGAGEIDPLTKSSPDVQGISRVGVHEDGVGAKRAITDLNALLRTDHYLKILDSNASCQNIRSNPPIYDYGGKPYATSDATSPLDLFKNAGSGTSVRGIDCSAFVFSAIATTGLKLHPDKKMKAILVHGISSTMYMNPVENGMSCFSKVKMGKSGTLSDGDIVAIKGHVFLIDSVGKDPLGLNHAQKVADCSKLVSDNFDFVVIQSSPSKNGIGINRYRGADYLSESATVQKGFVEYARQACKAKFENKDVQMSATNFQIIRHNQTSTCKDKRISLVGESCAQSCRSSASNSMQ